MSKASEKNTSTTQPQSGQQAKPSTSEENRNQMASQKSGNISRRYQSPGSSFFSLMPRDLITANPFELMRRFAEEMDRNFSNWPAAGKTAQQSAPAVEIFERNGKMIVKAALPGLKPDDVKVELTDDGLVIQGERKSEHEEHQQGCYHSEISYGSFYRVIPLPENINPDDVQANFNNGMLEVSLPVPERKKKQIQINSDNQQRQTAASGKG